MPVEKQDNLEGQDDFEPDPYEQLFLLLDAAQETQAGSAFRTLRAALKQNGLTVADYLKMKHGGGEDVAVLKAELAKERGRADEMDRAGVQLDADLTQALGIIEGLRRENVTLRQSVKNDPCWPCQVKARWIAVFLSLPLLWLLEFRLMPFDPTDAPFWNVWRFCTVLLLGLSPLLVVVWAWKVEQFKRKHHWKSRTDNDVWRAAAQKWNQFLGRFAMHG